MTPRAAGLDMNPRILQSTIELPAATLARLQALSPPERSFIHTYLHDARFTSTSVRATLHALVFPGLGWTFTHP